MIEEQNPWWISKDLVEENETYRRYKESPIKWIPDILDKISLTPFSLNFIFGPRQVGKTTALILLIKRLLDRGVNPKSVFYFTCEKIANHRELDQILEQYIKMKNRERIGSSYIILDEVTFPKDWYRSIKFRIDNGDFKNDVLILSGSLSIKAKGEIESFPGRRGNGKTLIMYPLPFSQYVRLFLNLPEMARSIEDSVSLAKKNIQFRSKIEEIFETYLITGGFPNSIKDYVIEGKIRSTTISDFISSVILDINKLRRSETFFKLAVKSIIERTSSEISFHNLAKEVGNIKTLISYVEFLQNLYFLKVLLAIDPNSGIPLPRKERKFYFIDPFLYKALANWVFTNVPDATKLAEAIAVSHLSRIFSTFYFKRNEELDIIVKDGEKFKGIEVKYGKVVRKVIGKIKDFIYLSRDLVDEKIVPTSLFLAFLDIPQSLETSEL